MIIANIVDCNEPRDVAYGILVCFNPEVTLEQISDFIDDYKALHEGDDWFVENLVAEFPVDWQIIYQKDCKYLYV